jgi:predicted nucleotidyltransferase
MMKLSLHKATARPCLEDLLEKVELLYGNLTVHKESDIVFSMRIPSGQQSHLRYPLTRLFGSPGNVRVLRVLADGLASSATQIASAAGLTPQGARLVLDVLAAQGIVTVKGSARTQLFELASVHPFRHPMLELFQAERAVWEDLVGRLRERLKKRAGVQAAWLYGSVARGEDTPASDIDVALLVSSSAVSDKVREDLMPIEDELNVHVSVTALTPQDLAALQDGDPWWSDVVRDARVLKGGRPEAEMKGVRARLAVA